MQNLLDSLCRCFGTPGVHEPVDFGSLSKDPIPNQRTPSTPDMKRRASRLALQDKQWDALFSDPVSSKGSSKNSKKQTNRVVSETASSRPRGIEHAQTVAQAKLHANLQTSHKRKRSRSKDDIFRSKKTPTLDAKRLPSQGGPCQPGSVNPISRFLTNHPALANSLCFATPVRDSQEEDDEEPATVPFDNHSVMSEGCDETITSTLYYETTKLASLRPERSPPMPLFTDYSVDRGDDIRKIVAMDTHSSAKRKDDSWYVPGFEDTLHGYDMNGDTYEQCPPPPVELAEEVAPQLTSSTDSSRESDRSR
jgi:hypothetical protein